MPKTERTFSEILQKKIDQNHVDASSLSEVYFDEMPFMTQVFYGLSRVKLSQTSQINEYMKQSAKNYKRQNLRDFTVAPPPQQHPHVDVKKEPEEPKIHFSKLSIKAQQCCVLLRSFGAEFVDQELTKTLIKQEFRRMAKKLHPDLNGENSELKKQEFALQFHKMNEAYNVLKLEVDEALLPPPM